MRDPLRHHRAHRDATPTRAERAAESFADFLGTTRFIVLSTVVIVLWIVSNAAAALFDPYPFILLNLAFSAFAFFTGALVIIAQKAQTKRDKASEAADAAHREELHAQLVQLIDGVHHLVDDKTPGGVGTVLAAVKQLSADE